jgi:hypothetical protein
MPVTLRTHLRNATTGEMLEDAVDSDRRALAGRIAQIERRYKIGEKDPGTACGNQKEAADIIWYLGEQTTQGQYANFVNCAN